MSKSTIGLIIYGVALAIGALLLVANFVFHAFDAIPNGFRIAVVIFAAAWLIVRYVLAKRYFPGGWRGKSRDDND